MSKSFIQNKYYLHKNQTLNGWKLNCVSIEDLIKDEFKRTKNIVNKIQLEYLGIKLGDMTQENICLIKEKITEELLLLDYTDIIFERASYVIKENKAKIIVKFY